MVHALALCQRCRQNRKVEAHPLPTRLLLRQQELPYAPKTNAWCKRISYAVLFSFIAGLDKPGGYPTCSSWAPRSYVGFLGPFFKYRAHRACTGPRSNSAMPRQVQRKVASSLLSEALSRFFLLSVTCSEGSQLKLESLHPPEPATVCTSTWPSSAWPGLSSLLSTRAHDGGGHGY